MICCSGRAPITCPSIMSTLSAPPSADGGTLVNSIDGSGLAFHKRQPHVERQRKTREVLLQMKSVEARSFWNLVPSARNAWTRTGLWKPSFKAMPKVGEAPIAGSSPCYNPCTAICQFFRTTEDILKRSPCQFHAFSASAPWANLKLPASIPVCQDTGTNAALGPSSWRTLRSNPFPPRHAEVWQAAPR